MPIGPIAAMALRTVGYKVAYRYARRYWKRIAIYGLQKYGVPYAKKEAVRLLKRRLRAKLRSRGRPRRLRTYGRWGS